MLEVETEYPLEIVKSKDAIELLNEVDIAIEEIRAKIAIVKNAIKSCSLTDEHEKFCFIQNKEAALISLNKALAIKSQRQSSLLMRIRSEARGVENSIGRAERIILNFKLAEEAQARKKEIEEEKTKRYQEQLKIDKEVRIERLKISKKSEFYLQQLLKIKSGIEGDKLSMEEILVIIELALKKNNF